MAAFTRPLGNPGWVFKCFVLEIMESHGFSAAPSATYQFRTATGCFSTMSVMRRTSVSLKSWGNLILRWTYW